MLQAAFLLAAVAVTSGIQEAEIRQQALDAVAQYLIEEGLAPEDFWLEMRGQPLLFPDHERWHDYDQSRPTEAVGVVKDETGVVIPGCEVVLIQDDEVLDRTVSGDSGEFHFEGLAPGEFAVRAALPGFKQAEVIFDLDPGRRREFEVVLEYGQITQMISVRAANLGSVGVTGRGLPQAMVLVLATIGDEVRSFNVLLPPGSRRGVIAPLPRGHRDLDRLPMTLGQWEQAVPAAAAFYEAATRFEDGPERFHPFIDTTWFEEHVDEGGWDADSMRRHLAFYLDATVLSTWLGFEGLELPRTTRESWMTEEEAMELAAHNTRAGRQQLIEHLSDERADDPRHRQALLPYLRRYLGEGLVGRRDLDGREVWVTRMMPYMSVFFDIVGGQLRIVSLVIHD